MTPTAALLTEPDRRGMELLAHGNRLRNGLTTRPCPRRGEARQGHGRPYRVDRPPNLRPLLRV